MACFLKKWNHVLCLNIRKVSSQSKKGLIRRNLDTLKHNKIILIKIMKQVHNLLLYQIFHATYIEKLRFSRWYTVVFWLLTYFSIGRKFRRFKKPTASVFRADFKMDRQYVSPKRRILLPTLFGVTIQMALSWTLIIFLEHMKEASSAL